MPDWVVLCLGSISASVVLLVFGMLAAGRHPPPERVEPKQSLPVESRAEIRQNLPETVVPEEKLKRVLEL